MPANLTNTLSIGLPSDHVCSAVKAFIIYHVSCVIAIITGIVSIDRKLTSATVLDAVAVSLP